MRPLTRVLSAVFVATTVLIGAQSGVYAAAPITQLNLHLSDLPAGFTVSIDSTAHGLNAKDVPPSLKHSQLNRVVNNLVSYVCAAHTGLLEVQSFLTRFATVSDSRAEMQQYVSDEPTYHAQGFVPFSSGSLGNQAIAETQIVTLHGSHLIVAALTFRRGLYVESLLAIAAEGTFSRGKIADLARVIDNRIRSEG
jgi:hypothetical protein